jgi:hypothetical protein
MAAYTIRPATGEVKLDTHLKDASVYVDGGYVGQSEFKKFRPSGNHDIWRFRRIDIRAKSSGLRISLSVRLPFVRMKAIPIGAVYDRHNFECNPPDCGRS